MKKIKKAKQYKAMKRLLKRNRFKAYRNVEKWLKELERLISLKYSISADEDYVYLYHNWEIIDKEVIR